MGLDLQLLTKDSPDLHDTLIFFPIFFDLK